MASEDSGIASVGRRGSSAE
jgi:hypothetical protein